MSAALAMTAFAANSVLARLALGDRQADPASFTVIRISAGAVVLILLASLGSRSAGVAVWWKAGSWHSAGFLVAYAACFSFAYLSLGAATGALVLFAVVQLVIFGVALRAGDQPSRRAWIGLALASVGIIALGAPGATAPKPQGVALMAAAGVAWACYTLRGRRVDRPLAATASNFVRGVPMAFSLAGLVFAFSRQSLHLTATGAIYAVLSGGVASGLGYAVWYAVLPALSRVQSGIIQLVPAPLAAIGGLLLISEPITIRIVAASVLILGGVCLGMLPGGVRPAGSPTVR